MNGLGKLSLLLLALWLFMASMAVAAIWLVEPAKADGLAATANGTANLTIRIERVSARGGILRLGLYDARQYPDDDSNPVAASDVPALAGSPSSRSRASNSAATPSKASRTSMATERWIPVGWGCRWSLMASRVMRDPFFPSRGSIPLPLH